MINDFPNANSIEYMAELFWNLDIHLFCVTLEKIAANCLQACDASTFTLQCYGSAMHALYWQKSQLFRYKNQPVNYNTKFLINTSLQRSVTFKLGFNYAGICNVISPQAERQHPVYNEQLFLSTRLTTAAEIIR